MANAGPRPGDRQPPLGLNDRVFDALVRHQILLGRMAAGFSEAYAAILNPSETRMRELLLERLGPISQANTPANRNRVRRLIQLAVDARREAWDTLFRRMRRDLNSVVRAELDFLIATYSSLAPVELRLQRPSLARVVSGTVFDGNNLDGWLRRTRATDLTTIRASIQRSATQGDSPAVAGRRLTGTRAQRGRNGLTQSTRNNLAGLARTSVVAMTNVTGTRLAAANVGVFGQEWFAAVLDGVTTPICRSLDGNIYDIGEGPIPPLHYGCRSRRVPLIDGEKIGNRTATPLFRRRLLREFTDANGLDRVRRRADLPRGFKGRFDAFRRRRAFEVIGPNEPATVNYQQWLRRQSSQFQDDVLGVTRARLFRQGGLTLDRFVDRSGRQITLSELARRDRQAFVDAGLDPDDPLWDSYVRRANEGAGG